MIDVMLEGPARTQIDVYDVAGRRVRHQDLGRVGAGLTRLKFDGLDDRGRVLRSGVYFYRINTAGSTVTRKMVIAR